MASSRVWTPEQQLVIDLRNRNILVSAAAGSGKTAVLVERILKKITDKEHPVDVDRLLVVTFTRAAATEMRERIGAAIEAAMDEAEEQDVNRLMKQATLLHSAQISTIDSFCKKLVEEHFHDIDLDPVFRVADEAELLLMKADICEQLLEESYEENSPEFRAFAESYATGKNDDALEDMILRLYGFAESYPNPDAWLLEQREQYAKDLSQSRFDALLADLTEQILDGALAQADAAKAVCLSENGPFAYEAAVVSDIELITELKALCVGLRHCDKNGVTEQEEDSYESLRGRLNHLEFQTLSRKKQEGVDEEKKELFKALRDQMKKLVKELAESFYFGSKEELQSEYEATVPGVLMLIRLTEEFRARFKERKRKNNLLDFSDLEHLALQILVDEEGHPTAAAAEYREFYDEILIDEYQDSNRIQELLLTSISKESLGRPNMFMVGDVKQSIYKFRQARPELFMEKYASYHKEDSLFQKIDLHKNFRSRVQVLDATNRIFESIMHRSFGGVEYDADAALYPGASYPALDEAGERRMQPEIFLLAAEAEEEKGTFTGSDENDYFAEMTDSREREALMVAGQIRRMKQEGFSYGDMVVLLRTMSGWSEVFLQVLTSEGIPAVCETASGYFTAWEVQVMLHLLRVLDNPRQDIPLTSVLLSPIGGFCAEELAQIKIRARVGQEDAEKGMYQDLLRVAADKTKQGTDQDRDRENDVQAEGNTEPDDLEKKVLAFLQWLEIKRRELAYTPVHELIRRLLNETGFYRYVSAMPAGRTRAANLDMLVEKAAGFEQSSYHGVFHFVRYIEKLHKYEVDYGEAGAEVDGAEVVRIMSIHKSKGLEFPVVIVSGMAKQFNQQDTRARVVLHPDLGIAVDHVDLSLRQKSPTLAKKLLQKQLVRDSLGEELRVLYVAFTRAREKLILTGVVKGLDKKLDKWRNQVIGDWTLMKSSCYLDMIMPVVLKTGADVAGYHFYLQCLTSSDLVRQEAEAVVSRKEQILRIMSQSGGNGAVEKTEYSPDEKKQLAQIERELNWQYPYAFWQERKGKITVTELKRLHLEAEEAGEVLAAVETEKQLSGQTELQSSREPVIPEFARTVQKMEGTTRGTLYHFVMEKLPFHRVDGVVSMTAFLDELAEQGRLTETERKAVSPQKFLPFLSDPLFERMKQAEQAGLLHRESPFVLGLPAGMVYGKDRQTEENRDDIDAVEAVDAVDAVDAMIGESDKETSEEELILVQGIIDAWFEEEDGIVLLDYKTDVVGEEGEELLRRRYRIQLDYYRQALEQLTGKKVKEELIYSFALGKSLAL